MTFKQKEESQRDIAQKPSNVPIRMTGHLAAIGRAYAHMLLYARTFHF